MSESVLDNTSKCVFVIGERVWLLLCDLVACR